MGSGEDASFDPDFADLIELAVVGSPAGYGYVFAEDFFQQEFVIFIELLDAGFVVFRDRDFEFFLERVDEFVAFRFGMLLRVEGIGQAGADVVF